MEGVLKALILNPWQCVCFAGHLDHAQTAVESIFVDELHQRFDDGAVLERLLDAHRDSVRDVGDSDAAEFLLGSLRQGQPTLYEVKGGAIASDRKASWLGSAEAFELYQRAYLAAPPAPHDEKAALRRMFDAFSTFFLGEHEHEDVGDFFIEVVTGRDGFRYNSRSYVFPPQPLVITSTEWQTIKIGSAAEGWYFYSVLRPERAAIPFVAIYFATAGFGVVLSPAHGRSTITAEGVTPEQFVERVEAEFNVRLFGQVMLEGGVVATFGKA